MEALFYVLQTVSSPAELANLVALVSSGTQANLAGYLVTLPTSFPDYGVVQVRGHAG